MVSVFMNLQLTTKIHKVLQAYFNLNNRLYISPCVIIMRLSASFPHPLKTDRNKYVSIMQIQASDACHALLRFNNIWDAVYNRVISI